MNREMLGKMYGKRVKLRPPAVLEDGVTEADVEWIVYKLEGDALELSNTRSDQHIKLDPKSIIEYQANPGERFGFFLSKVRVVLLVPRGYRIEPLDFRQAAT